MLKHLHVMFAVGTGQTTQGIYERNPGARVAGHGDGRNNTLQCERKRTELVVRQTLVCRLRRVRTGSDSDRIIAPESGSNA